LIAQLIAKIRRFDNQISPRRGGGVTIDAVGDVDNIALELTLAALKSCRVYFRFYETHLSTIEANTQTAAWFSCPHENQRRPRNPGTAPSTRPQTVAPKGGRNTLRAAYAGVTFVCWHRSLCLRRQLGGTKFFGWSRVPDFITLRHNSSRDEIKRSRHRIA
jgi:hypothetical protein